jgi:hypothetical protein
VLDKISWVCEPMFDGSVHPKNPMQMLECLPVPRYRNQDMRVQLQTFNPPTLQPYALIHHSTIVECDHTHDSYIDTRFARHSQVASQGTGAVNVRNAEMAMY